MSGNLTDQRIERVRPLVPPGLLRDQLPLTDSHTAAVLAGQKAIRDVLAGVDDRLIVIVGPCSVHDPKAALDYARRLADVAHALAGDLAVVIVIPSWIPRSSGREGNDARAEQGRKGESPPGRFGVCDHRPTRRPHGS